MNVRFILEEVTAALASGDPLLIEETANQLKQVAEDTSNRHLVRAVALAGIAKCYVALERHTEAGIFEEKWRALMLEIRSTSGT